MNPCRLTECLGKPRCARCLSQDSPDELTRLRTENESLRATLKVAGEALSAMLTHMGMDEDEWNKPTFDQARNALQRIREVQR